jgi:hypothetical protein
VSPLCRLRRFLGLTQLDVTLATGISVQRLSRAENCLLDLTPSEEQAVSYYLAARLRIVRELEAAPPDSPKSDPSAADPFGGDWYECQTGRSRASRENFTVLPLFTGIPT